MNRIFTRISVAALAGLATFGVSTDVAAQTTFEACRVPNVGAIYMINVAGAPTACLDPSHVMFSWTEGGAVGAGSIGTTELADNAVTAAKVADGAITQAKLDAGISIGLNPGDVGTAELADDAVTAAKIADGSVGTLALENAAIITGTHLNSNIVGSSTIVDGSVSTDDIANGSITTAKFAGSPIGSAQVINNSLTASDLASGSVGSSEIIDGSVGTADLAPGSAVFFTQADYGLSSFNTSSGTTTNLASISIDAPSSGIVLLMGTGYCNKTQGVTAYQIYLGWETSPSTVPSVIPGAFISSRPGAPAGSVQYPYATNELFFVNAGTNTFYLNGYNSNGGSHSCAGSNIIMFAPAVIS